MISLVSEQGNYSPCTASSQHFFLSLDSRTKISLRKFCPSVIGKYYWNDLPFLFVHYQLKSSSKKQFLSIILFKIDFLAYCCCAFWVCTCVCVYIVHVIYMCSVTVTFLFCRLLSHRRKLLCSPSEWVSECNMESEPKINSTDFDPIFQGFLHRILQKCCLVTSSGPAWLNTVF